MAAEYGSEKNNNVFLSKGTALVLQYECKGGTDEQLLFYLWCSVLFLIENLANFPLVNLQLFKSFFALSLKL